MCAIDLAVRGTLPPPCSRGRAARDNCNPRGEGRAQLTETTHRSSLRRSSRGSYSTIHGLLLSSFAVFLNELHCLSDALLTLLDCLLFIGPRRSLCLFSSTLVMSHILGFDQSTLGSLEFSLLRSRNRITASHFLQRCLQWMSFSLCNFC